MKKKQIRSIIEKFLKDTIMHNIGYKVLSILIAVMSWVIIFNIADPVTTKTFKSLEVEIRNQSAISSINQVYEIIEGSTIDFTVRGKASVVKNLKVTDFIAYADLSQLSPVYAADIKVECKKNELIEIDTNNKMLLVKLEDIATKNVQVAVETTGEVAEGYYVGDFEIKPNIITVSGGASKIEQLDSIKLTVNVAGAKKSFSTKQEPTAYDKDGNIMDADYFTFSNSNTTVNQVSIDVTIFKTKTIPVMFEISGKPADDYIYNNEYDYTPQTVVVGGTGRALSKLSSITIPIDITGAMGDYEENVNIDDYLPDNVKLVSNEVAVAIRVKLEKLIVRTILIDMEDIRLKNIPNGLRAEFVNRTDEIEMQLRGTSEQLEKFTSGNVGAYIDLADKKEGEYFIQPECENVPDDMYLMRPGIVNIRLTNEEEVRSTKEPVDVDESVIEPIPTPVDSDVPIIQ